MIDLRFIISSLSSSSRDVSLPAQGIRQVCSGAISTGVDLAIFQTALWLKLPVLRASVISFLLATAVNFCLTRYYVFGETKRQRKSMCAQVLLYAFTALASLGITQAILYIFAVRLGWPPLPVKIMAIPIVFVWTVLSGKYLVFDKQ